jgi:uncharacterized membrane protein HdeD (DUF308 family)
MRRLGPAWGETTTQAFGRRTVPGVLMGVLTAALGIALMTSPSATGAITTFVPGSTLAVVGFTELVLALVSENPGGLPLRLLPGVSYGLTGLVLIASPFNGALGPAVFAGLMLTVRGVLAGIVAFQVHGTPGWRWVLVDAMASFIVGGLILVRWPASDDWALGSVIGVAVLVTGVSRAFLVARSRGDEAAHAVGARGSRGSDETASGW